MASPVLGVCCQSDLELGPHALELNLPLCRIDSSLDGGHSLVQLQLLCSTGASSSGCRSSAPSDVHVGFILVVKLSLWHVVANDFHLGALHCIIQVLRHLIVVSVCLVDRLAEHKGLLLHHIVDEVVQHPAHGIPVALFQLRWREAGGGKPRGFELLQYAGACCVGVVKLLRSGKFPVGLIQEPGHLQGVHSVAIAHRQGNGRGR
mmetsp:Transcript_21223/g.58962  ORF Transcript_21223/g.58962 Transcript_21223/m.58962 type:complete len:205 (-) Transcript_21223:856-1470(-)